MTKVIQSDKLEEIQHIYIAKNNEFLKRNFTIYTNGINSKPSSERHTGCWQPRLPSDKIRHREPPRLRRACYNPVPSPSDPPRSAGTRTRIPILSVVQRVQSKVAIPLQPTRRIHQRIQIRLHEHRPRVLLPWPTQKRSEWPENWYKIRRGHDPGIVDWDSGVLVRVGSSLSCDGVFLLVHGTAGVYHAVLQNHGGVAEDEVDGAEYVAFLVELALWMDVECVLVPLEAAAVEDGEVGAGAERHCLMVLWAGGVAESYATGDESLASYRWGKKSEFYINSCNIYNIYIYKLFICYRYIYVYIYINEEMVYLLKKVKLS